MADGVTQEDDRQHLLARLDKLERQSRAAKRLAAAILVLACAAMLMGQAKPSVASSASAFRLKDASGVLRAELAMIKGAPTLLMFDRKQMSRLMLSVSGGDPKVVLYDKKGKPRMLSTIQANGTPATVFYDGAKKGRLTIALRPDGSPLLVFIKHDGKLLRSLP